LLIVDLIYEKSTPATRRKRSPYCVGIVHNLATLDANQGEIDQAITFYQESLELTGKIGDGQGKAITLALK
jgi:hypothetical protein